MVVVPLVQGVELGLWRDERAVCEVREADMNGGPHAPTAADYAQGAADEARRRVDRLERIVERLLLLLRADRTNPDAANRMLDACLKELQR